MTPRRWTSIPGYRFGWARTAEGPVLVVESPLATTVHSTVDTAPSVVRVAAVGGVVAPGASGYLSAEQG